MKTVAVTGPGHVDLPLALQSALNRFNPTGPDYVELGDWAPVTIDPRIAMAAAPRDDQAKVWKA